MLVAPGLRLVLVFFAAGLGGAINAVAGGGTLATFPALVGLGIPPITANATSTVALWPGTLGSMYGYRDALVGTRAWITGLAIPSALGGLIGALLLLHTTERQFDAIVPWLVLGATLLFMVQRPVLEWLRRRRNAPLVPGADAADRIPPPPGLKAWLYQLAMSIYGGYFGAGMGILSLAGLGFMGFTNIHRMNGLKNWIGLCINVVAAVTFVVSGLVDWPVALAMAAGATAGGYVTSRLAQRIPQVLVRRAIVLIGFGSGIWLLRR